MLARLHLKLAQRKLKRTSPETACPGGQNACMVILRAAAEDAGSLARQDHALPGYEQAHAAAYTQLGRMELSVLSLRLSHSSYQSHQTHLAVAVA